MDDEALRSQIADGTKTDRWHLAGKEGLPAWAYRALLNTGESEVIASLVQNPGCDPDVLDEIANRNGESLAQYARINPNARPETKDPSPAGSHSTRSIDLYLTARNATIDQRRSFAERYKQSPVSGGPLIGEIWQSVLSEGERDA